MSEWILKEQMNEWCLVKHQFWNLTRKQQADIITKNLYKSFKVPNVQTIQKITIPVWQGSWQTCWPQVRGLRQGWWQDHSDAPHRRVWGGCLWQWHETRTVCGHEGHGPSHTFTVVIAHKITNSYITTSRETLQRNPNSSLSYLNCKNMLRVRWHKGKHKGSSLIYMLLLKLLTSIATIAA